MTTSNTPIYASQARPWLKFYDQKYIDQTMPACTAFELVCRQNKNRLGETALEYYGRKFTYADFIVNVKKTAAALRAAGLKKGDIAQSKTVIWKKPVIISHILFPINVAICAKIILILPLILSFQK